MVEGCRATDMPSFNNSWLWHSNYSELNANILACCSLHPHHNSELCFCDVVVYHSLDRSTKRWLKQIIFGLINKSRSHCDNVFPTTHTDNGTTPISE
jgi:hypothetical protein